MHRFIIYCFIFFITLMANIVCAATPSTIRLPQFSNDKVTVWETIIYPTAHQMLKPHRHEHDRVLVAFHHGTLKVKNNKGKTHYLHFEKNKSYFLKQDLPGEMHTDENIGHYPLKVLVIELKK